jgi:hypothetical protein
MIQKKNRIRRCSFCSRTEKRVSNLIYKSNVSICDDCVDTCQTIIVTGGEKLRLLEWGEWSRHARTREFQMLQKAAFGFRGAAEAEVIGNFGKPDRISGPDEVRHISGKLLYKLDKQLTYSGYSPHVRILFGILRGKVREVILVPLDRAGNKVDRVGRVSGA